MAINYKRAPVDVWEVLLRIKSRIVLHDTGKGRLVPAVILAGVSLLVIISRTVMDAYVAKLISAALYLSPTSHCLLSSTPSSTPSTRKISFS